jgi:hypothetical protein
MLYREKDDMSEHCMMVLMRWFGRVRMDYDYTKMVGRDGWEW